MRKTHQKQVKKQGYKQKGNSLSYQDISGDVGDLQGERKHIELAHNLEDQLGVGPRQLQQVQQVRRVAVTQDYQVRLLFLWSESVGFTSNASNQAHLYRFLTSSWGTVTLSTFST